MLRQQYAIKSAQAVWNDGIETSPGKLLEIEGMGDVGAERVQIGHGVIPASGPNTACSFAGAKRSIAPRTGTVAPIRVVAQAAPENQSNEFLGAAAIGDGKQEDENETATSVSPV